MKHNFVNRLCNRCGILDTDPHETPCADECSCHTEHLKSHEACCGHENGRNPDCSIHGDNGRIWVTEAYANQARGEVRSAMCGGG